MPKEEPAQGAAVDAAEAGVAAEPGKPLPAAAGRTGNPREIGGPKGLDPVRFGDWERGGRCIDF